MSTPLIDIAGVSKQYGALRPLRIERLQVEAGDQVAILGFDQPAAEVFIGLVTGASLPDAGSVHAFGTPTAAIADSTEWLSTLDRFGIVSVRAALLDAFSVVQNLAVPFSLAIDPPSEAIRHQAIALAREAGLGASQWDRRAGDLEPATQLRVRLARALALGPAVLLLEHPTATIARSEVSSLAREIRQLAERRGIATITLTQDQDFARHVATRTLTHEPATGRLKEARFGRIPFWS